MIKMLGSIVEKTEGAQFLFKKWYVGDLVGLCSVTVEVKK